MSDFTITGDFAVPSTDDNHLNYIKYTELISLIGSFLTENYISDPIRLEMIVPHENFRDIDSGIRKDIDIEDSNKAEDKFEVAYDKNFSVLVADETSEILAKQQNNG